MSAHEVTPIPAVKPGYEGLEAELRWFCAVVDARMQAYFATEGEESPDVAALVPPDLSDSECAYARGIRDHALGFGERLALILALVPHLRPKLLDVFFVKNATFDRRFTEFGGRRPADDDAFLPTGETLAFLLGGADLAARFAVEAMFRPPHPFYDHDLVRIGRVDPGRPVLRGVLEVPTPTLALLTRGAHTRPAFGADFPARFIRSGLDWEDLVLHPSTAQQVGELHTWLAHGTTLLDDWSMGNRLRPGFRALFYGPPGTGKTATACVLGAATGRDVYKVDLSMVVSKYIGETEKNLARVFDRAQARGWILFFDEADALFGKRSETRDAHDRYANQEVSFLLQRIETFDGVAILASNQRNNVDAAFTRRFEAIIYFPMPRAEERLQLWRQGFSPRARFEPDVDLEALASRHDLAGGSIMNVIRYASLQAIAAGDDTIRVADLERGVRLERAKEGAR